ncbi:MAG: hypothetical protein JNK05_05235 [Myxococcales bacterium]|nr:hypothetical protein [Myxococcales bacterium]
MDRGRLATRPVLLQSRAEIDELAVGDAALCVRLRNETVECIGANDRGQLGVEGGDRWSFAPVPGLREVVQLSSHAGRYCARSRDGSVRCWGSYLVLREAEAQLLITPPTRIATPGPVRSIYSQGALSIELEDGTRFREFSTFEGIVGRWVPADLSRGSPLDLSRTWECGVDGSTLRCQYLEVRDLPPGFQPRYVSARGACGLLGGALFCRDFRDDFRQTRTRPSRFTGWDEAVLPRITTMSVSDGVVCALDERRFPFCWGFDGGGGHGLAHTTTTPVRVDLGAARAQSLADSPAIVAFEREVVQFDPVTTSVEALLPPPQESPFASSRTRRTVLFSTSAPVRQFIASAGYHCVLADRTQCRIDGAAAIEPFDESASATQAIALENRLVARIRSDGRVEARDVHNSASRVLEVPLDDARSLLVRNGLVCALDGRGTLRCAPPVSRDEVVPPLPTVVLASNVRSIEDSGETKCLIDQQGRPFCWGNKSSWIFDPNTRSAVTEPRLVAFDRPVRSISVSGGVILVLAEDGSVFCRGNNLAEQCGSRSSRAPADWTRIEGLGDVRSVHARAGTPCAIHRDGSVWCWGPTLNGFGAVPRSDHAMYIAFPR